MALTRKKITVRGKSGKTFQRSVMVRAGEAVKRTAKKVAGFVGKHKGKIAGAAALAGAAYLGVRHRSQIGGLAKGLHTGLKNLHELHTAAKGAGMRVDGATARHIVGKAVGEHRELGRTRDDVRVGNQKDRASAAVGRAKSTLQGMRHDAGKAREGYSLARATGSSRREAAGLAREEYSARRKHSSRSGR